MLGLLLSVPNKPILFRRYIGFVSIILYQIVLITGQGINRKEITVMHPELDVLVELPSDTVYLNRACMVKILVLNKSKNQLKVNKRMALGYRESISREIFVDINDPITGSNVKTKNVDYNRNYPEINDYIFLKPEDSLQNRFDLFRWYKPLREGTYQLIFHYQADELSANAPKDVISGIFSSKPVFLTILTAPVRSSND